MPEPDEIQPVAPDAGGQPAGESGGQAAPSEGAEQFLEVGGEKYAPDQAKELIEAGKTYRELKGKYPDVDFGGMVPTFTQQRQLLSDPQRLQQYYAEKFAQQQQQAQVPGGVDPNSPEVQQAAAMLRSLGFMTQDEYQQKQQQQEFEGRLGSLEKEIDGSDGRPKFDRVKVLEYMQKNPVYDPAVAYEAMNSQAIREWYAAKKMASKPKAVTSERGGAGIPIVTKGKAPKFGTPEFYQSIDKVLEGSAE